MTALSSLRSSSAGPASRGGDHTRRRILAAAQRLISHGGFHGTSIRAIARSVGVTEAAIYYHFPSKRALVEALYQERGFLTALEQLEHLTGDRPLEAQLAANAVASARLWEQNADFLRVLFMEVLRGDAAARAAHEEIMGRWQRGMATLFARYQARAAIDPSVDVADAALTWTRLLFGILTARLLANVPGRRRALLTAELRGELKHAALAFCTHVRHGSPAI